MKTGFIHGYPNKPVKKYYSYHGDVRDCLIQPDPDPFEDFPTDVPYGPTQYMLFTYIFIAGYYVQDPSYEVVNSAGAGTYSTSKVGQGYYPYLNQYLGRRSGIAFDTIALPDEAKIVSGKMTLQVASTSGWDPFWIVIRNGMPTFPHLYPYPADYSKSAYGGNGGSCKFKEPQIINFNEQGVSWINKFGITKFQLISSKDLSKTEPVAAEIVYYKMTGAYHNLEVGYKLPL